MKKTIFEAKQAMLCFDNPKWIRISRWRYFLMSMDGGYVLRARRVDKKELEEE